MNTPTTFPKWLYLAAQGDWCRKHNQISGEYITYSRQRDRLACPETDSTRDMTVAQSLELCELDGQVSWMVFCYRLVCSQRLCLWTLSSWLCSGPTVNGYFCGHCLRDCVPYNGCVCGHCLRDCVLAPPSTVISVDTVFVTVFPTTVISVDTVFVTVFPTTVETLRYDWRSFSAFESSPPQTYLLFW